VEVEFSYYLLELGASKIKSRLSFRNGLKAHANTISGMTLF
jgi:hypothetical protein